MPEDALKFVPEETLQFTVRKFYSCVCKLKAELNATSMDKRRKYNNAKNFTWHFSQTPGQKLRKNYFSSWHLLKGWYR